MDLTEWFMANEKGRTMHGVMKWLPIRTAPEQSTVVTIVRDAKGERNEQPLKRLGRLWFFPDGSMYVYYQPTHWRPLGTGEGGVR
ncbi:MAG: hypothetical protein LUE17_05940 [Planctomycetaceae bacterium]|nr:hypothetical protein [Planctomycetaceae bacterium]